MSPMTSMALPFTLFECFCFIALVIPFPYFDDRFKKMEATYLKSYKISGADKNIGAIVAIASYLLGQSSSGRNVKLVAETELQFFQKHLFGGSEVARTGLRMIPAFYHRDYKLLRAIYLEGVTPAESKKITATLNAHEARGSFPTGSLLPRVTHFVFPLRVQCTTRSYLLAVIEFILTLTPPMSYIYHMSFFICQLRLTQQFFTNQPPTCYLFFYYILRCPAFSLQHRPFICKWHVGVAYSNLGARRL